MAGDRLRARDRSFSKQQQIAQEVRGDLYPPYESLTPLFIKELKGEHTKRRRFLEKLQRDFNSALKSKPIDPELVARLSGQISHENVYQQARRIVMEEWEGKRVPVRLKTSA